MKPKVLIVDDEAFSLEFLQQLLGTQFAFEYAGNGHDALTAVAAGNPAVVLMDVEMPEAFGDDVTSYLVSIGFSVPVYLLSNLAVDQLEIRAAECGARGFISKGIGLDGVLGGQPIQSIMHRQDLLRGRGEFNVIFLQFIQ